MRVVSLIASATEIACFVGGQKYLVGRSHECDYPKSVESLPVCTAPRFSLYGSSSDIDERVKNSLHNEGAVYKIFEALINDLQPDVILTQTQCEICAVSKREVDEAVKRSITSNPKVVALRTNQFDELWEDIKRVAEALEMKPEGEKLISDLKKRINCIKSETANISSRPNAAIIEWLSPVMVGGNWIPELISDAGAKAVIGEPGKHSFAIPFEQLLENDPEYILITLCGWDIEKSISEMYNLTEQKKWSSLRAVKENNVYIVNGNFYFNRPSPRLVDSLEIAAEIFHPDKFNFGHRENSFIKF